jgi:hypothetical protein
VDRARHADLAVRSDIGRKWTAEGAHAVAEIGFMLVLGILLAVEVIWTLHVVRKDDPGPRLIRRDYDTRRPG